VTSHGDPWVTAAVVVAAAVYYSSSWARTAAAPYIQDIRDWFEADTDPVDEIHRQYRTGEIDETELERRLDMEMDENNERIRTKVEQISGVGPVTAREVALAFDSVGELRRADSSDLESVPNVGPQRAEQIADRF